MVKPEKMEEKVDEIWEGKRSGRIFADIVPRKTSVRRKVINETLVTHIEPPVTKEEIEEISTSEVKRKRQVPGRRFWVRFGTLAMVVAVIVAAVFNFLPRAEIAVVLKKSSVNFEERIDVRKDIFSFRLENGRLLVPAEFFSNVKNLKLLFPATGRRQVEIKAQGQLKVYNAFSSQPQMLVANTRFSSPEGKIFRLVRPVTVPGAKVVNGQIVPSSIIVEVAADKAGAEFNLENSFGQWRIPAFSGTPRYDKFYAEAISPLTGGFVGEKAFPTENDINRGREEIEKNLRESLAGEMMAVQENLLFLDGATSFQTTKVEVDETADANGMFGIFAEAEMKQIGFNEKILKDALIVKLKPPLEENLKYSLEEKDFRVGYVLSAADFNKGFISFTARGGAVFQPPFNPEEFKRAVMGLKEEDLKIKTFAINGLERAKITLWPFWVHRVPNRLGAISVVVE